MVKYTLEITFTEEQLQLLHATGTNIVVAKKGPCAAPNVAWQVWRPLQHNTLSWQEKYGIYASGALYNNGIPLSTLAAVPAGAAVNRAYTLDGNAVISAPGAHTAAPFTLLNNYPGDNGYLTIGLHQDAVVNGTEVQGNAVSAALVLYQRTAILSPASGIYIWLQPGTAGNTVLTKVRSLMTLLEFREGQETMTLAYDTASGKFKPSRYKHQAVAPYLPASVLAV